MKSSSQRGLSLVELLIATVLGLFIISGLFTIYLSNKKTYHLNEALAHMQENARIAISRLNHDIRMANNVKFITDKNGLLITELDPGCVSITSIDNNKITVLGHTNFSVGDNIQISNYQQTQTIKITSITNTKNAQILTIEPELIHTENYQVFSEANRILRLLYYVADTGRKDPAGNAIFALYRSDQNNLNAPSELVEGIEKMQIFYHLQHHPDHDYSANEISDWSKVTSVRIALFLNNEYLKREWDTVIALRDHS